MIESESLHGGRKLVAAAFFWLLCLNRTATVAMITGLAMIVGSV